MKNLFEKLLAFLRVRTVAAGLEVSDRVIRFVRFDGKIWRMDAIRLEPGILENGRIENREALIASFSALKEKATRDKRKKVNIVLCMSSVPTYTQTFALPVMKGGDLDQTVDLNMKMASPLEAGQAYSGWQLLERDPDSLQLQILSVFIEKKVVDDIVDALFEAGFLVMAVESRALALARMLREKGAGVDVAKPYLFIDLDNTGVDFLIVRGGSLYFEFSTSWNDLADEKGDISVERFEASFGTSLRQVVNFYRQHWQEPLAAIILSAVALEEEAEKVIADESPFPAVKLTLIMGQPVSSEWLVALGSSLRNAGIKAKDHEVSLLGEDSEDRFHAEQFLDFMRFWRVVIPVVLGLTVVMFVVADAFLASTQTQIESRSDFSFGGSQTTEIGQLQVAAADFNQSVDLLASAEATINPKSVLLSDLLPITTKNRITITRLAFQSYSDPIALTGSAPTQDDVVAFKMALVADPNVKNVSLPLTSIQSVDRQVTFSMTFTFVPPAAAPQ